MEKYGGVPAKKIETIEEYYSKIVGNTEPTYGMSSKDKMDFLAQHRPELFDYSGV